MINCNFYKQISYWRECEVCKDEFRSKEAKKCEKCLAREKYFKRKLKNSVVK